MITLIECSCLLEFFHVGIEYEFGAEYGIESLARATQLTTERFLGTFMRQLAGTRWGLHLQNCVFMGGVALNCVANSHIRDIWNDMWIMPNPGDCGSSLGAAALAYGKRLNWQGPYLGTNIPGEYPSEEISSEKTELLDKFFNGATNGAVKNVKGELISTKKITYWFPTLFCLGFIVSILLLLFDFKWLFSFYYFYFMIALLLAWYETKSLKVSVLSILAIVVQFFGYGCGFLKSTIAIGVLNKKPEMQFPELFFKVK